MVFESNKVVLTKNDVFYLGKGFATCDMFKLNIINKIPSFFAYVSQASNLWHGKLEHVSYKRIKCMIKLGLISNLDDLSMINA